MEKPDERIDKGGLIEFIVLAQSRVIKPFEQCFKGQLTSLQIGTLSVLYVEGTLATTKLAERLGVQKQQMTRLIGGLVMRGYVSRSYPNEDKRITLLSLTDSARKMLTEKQREFMDALGERSEADGHAIENPEKIVREFTELLGKLPDRNAETGRDRRRGVNRRGLF